MHFATVHFNSLFLVEEMSNSRRSFTTQKVGHCRTKIFLKLTLASNLAQQKQVSHHFCLPHGAFQKTTTFFRSNHVQDARAFVFPFGMGMELN